ncbi:98_t:CDS:2, partial [Acaulospora morrowiae]
MGKNSHNYGDIENLLDTYFMVCLSVVVCCKAVWKTSSSPEWVKTHTTTVGIKHLLDVYFMVKNSPNYGGQKYDRESEDGADEERDTDQTIIGGRNDSM